MGKNCGFTHTQQFFSASIKPNAGKYDCAMWLRKEEGKKHAENHAENPSWQRSRIIRTLI